MSSTAQRAGWPSLLGYHAAQTSRNNCNLNHRFRPCCPLSLSLALPRSHRQADEVPLWRQREAILLALKALFTGILTLYT